MTISFPPSSPPSAGRSRASVVALALLWLLAIAPAVVPLYVVIHDGVDLLFLDQWDHEILDVSLAARHGHVSPYLFQQHNEHRVFVPKLLYMGIDPLSHGNAKVQMGAEWVVVLATSFVVLALLRRATGPTRARPMATALLWLACNVLIFSPIQLENWLWGIGLMNVFPMAFIASMLLMLHRHRVDWRRLLAAIGFASAATFSSGNGVLAWPLGAVLLVGHALAPSPQPASTRRQWRVLAVWLAAMAINAALFLHGYHNMAQPQQEMYHSTAAVKAVYVLAFLGSPFAFLAATNFTGLAEVVGLALLVPTTWLALRAARLRRSDPGPALDLLTWGCIAAFTLLSALMAARTRAGIGIEQAITSRYTSFALYLPVALIGSAGVVLGHRAFSRAQRRVAFVGVLVIAALSVAAYPDALRRANLTRIIRLQAKGALLMIDPLPDNPQLATLVYPMLDILQEQAHALDAAGWLRPPLIRTTDARQLAMPNPPPPDQVGRLEHILPISAAELGVTGWALLPELPGQRAPADAVFVTCQAGSGPDVPVAMGQIRVYRPDVAMHFGDACGISGWTALVPTAKLAAQAERGGPLRLHAWSLDVKTGSASQLAGEVTVTGPKP